MFLFTRTFYHAVRRTKMGMNSFAIFLYHITIIRIGSPGISWTRVPRAAEIPRMTHKDKGI